MVQTEYGYNQPLGLPGGIYDLSDKRINTRTLDSKVAAKPGMGLVRGATAGETVSLPKTGSTAAQFEGVFVNGSLNMEHNMAGEVVTDGSESVGLMTQGRIWALVADTATTTYGTTVALIISGNNAGKFTSSGDSAETSKVALSGVTFTGKADSDNGIAVIEMD